MGRYVVWVNVKSEETRKAVVDADSAEAAQAEVEAEAEALDIWGATQDAGVYGDTDWNVVQVEELS